MRQTFPSTALGVKHTVGGTSVSMGCLASCCDRMPNLLLRFVEPEEHALKLRDQVLCVALLDIVLGTQVERDPAVGVVSFPSRPETTGMCAVRASALSFASTSRPSASGNSMSSTIRSACALAASPKAAAPVIAPITLCPCFSATRLRWSSPEFPDRLLM